MDVIVELVLVEIDELLKKTFIDLYVPIMLWPPKDLLRWIV